jgi:spermidine synthase
MQMSADNNEASALGISWEQWRLIAALTAGSALLGAWELVVTRLASLLYFIDIAYLALAVCLLALGVGALLAKRYAPVLPLRVVLALMALSMPVIVWAMLRHDAAWVLLTFAWPFLLFGMASTLAWQRISGARRRGWLYAAEMVGAVIGLILLGPLLLPLLPVDMLGDVGIDTHFRATVRQEGLIAHQAHTNRYARTDFLQTERKSVAYIFTDAMFVTRSVQWDGLSQQFDDPEVAALAGLKRLAMRAGVHDSVLLLGAGAGFDVAVALQEGAQRVDAVEVNPQTIAFARAVDDWAGGVLGDSRVNVVVGEGRRYVENTVTTWDQISLNLLQTSPASGRGRSHVDGRILTVEAIRLYLQHLKPFGMLTVIQNSSALATQTRAAVLVAKHGQMVDVEEYGVVSIRLAEPGQNPFSHLILTRNEAFTESEIATIRDHAKRFGAELTADPASATDRPATDDRPFMFEPGIRLAGSALFALVVSLLMLITVIFRQRRDGPAVTRQAAAAGLVGMAMLALQVVVVYRFQTAIGNPSVALSLSLATVLGGVSIGAMLFGTGETSWRRSGCLAISGAALFCITGAPVAELSSTMEPTLATALMVTFVGLCCLPIGLPFLALMQVARQGGLRNEGGVIGCDGIGGVIGVAAATLVSITFGFNAVGWLIVAAFAGYILLEKPRFG